jgi:tRNA threonylcarbamoyladenosine biosynthesis protein TsaE
MSKKNIKKYRSFSPSQTFSLGRKLARQIKGGRVISLSGELGAGKTVLVKGLAAGLGIKKVITSPTFVLMKVYPIAARDLRPACRPAGFVIRRLVHIDCYRINDAAAIVDIGATEYFNQPNTIVVIEWPEKIKSLLPKNVLPIKILIKKDNEREIIMN